MPVVQGRWEEPEYDIDKFVEQDDSISEQEAMNLLVQKLDRIMSGKAGLKVKNMTQGIAMTGSNEILFNHYAIMGMAESSAFRDRLAMFLAVNIHELGHVHYSTHWQNPYWVERRKEYGSTSYLVDYALNLLEDQRQELLEGVRFPRARDWQKIAILGLIRKAGNAQSTGAFPLFYGRRHLLPKKVIDSMEATFTRTYGQTKTNKVKAIISEFQRTLPFGEGLNRMWDLAVELKEITDGSLPGELCTSGKKTQGTEKEKAQEKTSTAANDALDKFDEAQEQGEAGSSDGEAESRSLTKKEIEKELDKLSDKIQERIQDDLEDSIRTVHDLEDGYGIGMGDEDGRAEMPIDSAYLNDAVALSRLFKLIAIDLKQKDMRNMKSGRLDIRRLSTCLAQNSNRMFKKRVKDVEDEARMAIAVMFDTSSSMGHYVQGRTNSDGSRMTNAQLAAQAAFTVAKGAELAGHLVQIEKFSNDTHMVKPWNSRKYVASVSDGGGTEPYSGIAAKIKELERIGNSEDIRNKVLIIATDGGFGQADHCAEAIKRLKSMGVHIYIIGINYNADRVQHYDPITDTYSYPKGNPYPGAEVSKVEDAGSLFGAMKDILGKLEIEIAKDIKRRMV